MLDIGCGEGIFAKILFSDKVDVGIDPQSQEIARASHLGQYSKLIQCFGDDIPEPDQSFQTILSNSVLEHIKDLKPVLKEAHRLLATDGNFYITVPTNYFDNYSLGYQFLKGLGFSNLAQKFRLFFNSFWAHYHFYDRESWIQFLESCGFEVADSQEYCSKMQGTLNDMLSVFSIPSLFQKKFFNKWFIFPRIRNVSATILSKFFSSASQVDGRIENGGIIFFHLKKRTI